MAPKIMSQHSFTLATILITLAHCYNVSGTTDNPLCTVQGEPNKAQCNHQAFPSKDQDPALVQSYVLVGIELQYRYEQDVGEDTYCYAIKVRDGKFHYTVHGFFVCEGGVTLECLQCFNEAVEGLKEVCPGRAGGTISLDGCCFRYEIYPFCQTRRS